MRRPSWGSSADLDLQVLVSDHGVHHRHDGPTHWCQGLPWVLFLERLERVEVGVMPEGPASSSSCYEGCEDCEACGGCDAWGSAASSSSEGVLSFSSGFRGLQSVDGPAETQYKKLS